MKIDAPSVNVTGAAVLNVGSDSNDASAARKDELVEEVVIGYTTDILAVDDASYWMRSPIDGTLENFAVTLDSANPGTDFTVELERSGGQGAFTTNPSITVPNGTTTVMGGPAAIALENALLRFVVKAVDTANPPEAVHVSISIKKTVL